MRGFQTTPRSIGEIERVARDWRRTLAPRVRPHEALDMLVILDAVERASVTIDREKYRTTTEVRDGYYELGSSYFSKRENRFVIQLSARSYDELEARTPRAAFTVAHEIGHIALHHRDLQQRVSMPAGALARETRLHRAYENTEWQADTFAAALLMPLEGLRLLTANARRFGEELDAHFVREHYEVSHAAASHRLRILRKKGVLA